MIVAFWILIAIISVMLLAIVGQVFRMTFGLKPVLGYEVAKREHEIKMLWWQVIGVSFLFIFAMMVYFSI